MKYLWIFFVVTQTFALQKVKFIFKDWNKYLSARKVSFILSNKNNDDYHYSIAKYNPTSKNHLKQNERLLEPGIYTIIYYISYPDYRYKFKEKIQITPQTQKIIVWLPAIRLRESRLDADKNSFERYQNYYYYNQICNGIYTDYYTNGHKKTEGKFKNGKPVFLTEYDKYSQAKKQTTYTSVAQPKEIILYDKTGKLLQRKLYHYGKRYITLKIYDAQGKLISRTKYNKY